LPELGNRGFEHPLVFALAEPLADLVFQYHGPIFRPCQRARSFKTRDGKRGIHYETF
jgi:hypothetical protein